MKRWIHASSSIDQKIRYVKRKYVSDLESELVDHIEDSIRRKIFDPVLSRMTEEDLARVPHEYRSKDVQQIIDDVREGKYGSAVFMEARPNYISIVASAHRSSSSNYSDDLSLMWLAYLESGMTLSDDYHQYFIDKSIRKEMLKYTKEIASILVDFGFELVKPPEVANGNYNGPLFKVTNQGYQDIIDKYNFDI